MAPIEGSAVTVYCNNVGYPDRLRDILDQDGIRDLPLVVLPVAGEYRTGKSFLLSYWLKYLTNQNFGAEDEELVGFDHKYDTISVTQGIKVWNKPLTVKRQTKDGSNEKILVLLMDSQGVFSSGDEEESTRNFALTAMISSIMVFNLMGQLNESVLGSLQLFTAYAKQANNTDDDAFQKLILLIRDWGKNDINPYGSQGGKKYLDKYFKDKRKSKTESFQDFFKDIDCYLMPKPGRCVDKKTYNGCLKELDGDFREYLTELTEYMFNPEHLEENLKEVVPGQNVTAGEFCVYFKLCTENLKNVDWEQPGNVLKMNATFVCDVAKREAMKLYKANMDKKTNSPKSEEQLQSIHRYATYENKKMHMPYMNTGEKSFMTEEQLKNIHKDSKDEAMNKFEEKSTFTRKNDKELYTEYTNKLNEELEEEFSGHKNGLENAKVKRKQEEQLTQIEAKKEAKDVYKTHMDNETSSFRNAKTKAFMTEDHLQSIAKDAEVDAINKYQEICSSRVIIFDESYEENKHDLIKALKKEFSGYKKLYKAEQQRIKDKEESERKRVEALAAIEKQRKKDKEESKRKRAEDKAESERQQREAKRHAEQQRQVDRNSTTELLADFGQNATAGAALGSIGGPVGAAFGAAAGGAVAILKGIFK